MPVNLKKFNRNKNFLFFCGIGNPDEFRRTLKKYKFKIKEEFIFPDHYNFSNQQVSELKNIAKNKKLEIITTEKDYLRLNKRSVILFTISSLINLPYFISLVIILPISEFLYISSLKSSPVEI